MTYLLQSGPARPPSRSLVVMSFGRRLAAIALAAVLAAGGCSGSDDKDDGAGTTSTTAEGGGGTEAPTPTPEGWARSTSEALNDAGAAATLNAILPPEEDGQWVLAGTTFDAEGVPRATVWRSADALSWKAASVGPRNTEAFDATRRADGDLVVVGRQLTGDTSKAAAWVEDGSTFVAAKGGDAFAGDPKVAMLMVAARTDGLVALGFRGAEGKEDSVAVWRSADGTSWERLPAAESVFATPGRTFVNHVAAVPSGLVALGGIHRGDHFDAAVWFSADGATWEAAAPAPDFGGPGDQDIFDVVPSGDGLLAVGATHDGRRLVPAAWRSPDGRAWSPAGATFERQGESSDTVGNQVTNVEPIAAGFVATGGGGVARRMWLSETGAAWQEFPLPDNAGYAENFNVDILASDGTDVVAASSVDGAPRVLLLRQGEWTEVTATASGFPAPRPAPSTVAVANTDAGFVATVVIGRAGRTLGTERTESLAFTSRDGLRWERAKGGRFNQTAVYDVAADPSGRPLAVGGVEPSVTSATSRTFVTYVFQDGSWRRGEVATLPGDSASETATRLITGAATRGERMVAGGAAFVGSGAEGNVDGVVFRKDGSGRLTVVDGVPGLTGPDDEYVSAVCAGPPGFLVVGAVERRGDSDGAAWFSADGSSWQQVQAPSFGGPGNQAFNDCTAAEGGFVIAGGDAAGAVADAAAWTSADGRTWARVAAPVFGGDDFQIVTGLASAGPGVMAVGRDSSSGDEVAALWYSGDSGATWERVDPGSPFRGRRSSSAESVVIAGDRIVIGGLLDDRVAIWSGPWPLRRVS